MRGGVLKSPFSAPYAYPVKVSDEEDDCDYVDALDALEEYLKGIGAKTVQFTLPPTFYDENLLTAWVDAFYKKGYKVTNLDLNYAIDLKTMNVNIEQYVQMITQKGRKAFKKALRSNLTIQKCETEADYAEAYKIMSNGHDAKGFPVKLTFERLMATMEFVPHDAFIVRSVDVGIVAEFLYRVNDRIVQGIYTGTNPDYMNVNGMNLLTYHTIKYYGDLGYEILDKATATEDSEPNYGLCNFKESVGCKRSLKYTFMKEL